MTIYFWAVSRLTKFSVKIFAVRSCFGMLSGKFNIWTGFRVRVVGLAMVIGQVIHVDEMFIPVSGIGGGTHPCYHSFHSFPNPLFGSLREGPLG